MEFDRSVPGAALCAAPGTLRILALLKHFKKGFKIKEIHKKMIFNQIVMIFK